MDFDKDFEGWTAEKKNIDIRERQLFFKEGEIWWCHIGINVKEEICGKGKEYCRPVVVLRKLSKNTAIIIPLTSRYKEGTWYTNITIHNKISTACMHQIRFISVNRLINREAVLPDDDFVVLKKSLALLLRLS